MSARRNAPAGSVECGYIRRLGTSRSATTTVYRSLLCFIVGIFLFQLSAAANWAHADVTGQKRYPQLSGRIIDSSTGAGIPGVTVTVHAIGGSFRQVLETDFRGGFYLKQVEPGAYRITATRPDYSPGSYGQLWPEGPPRLLRVLNGEPSYDVTIRLWRSSAIEGTVRTQRGDGLADTNVVLISRTTVASLQIRPIVMKTRTNSLGAYRFLGVPPGKYVVGTPQSYRTVCRPSAGRPRCVLSSLEQSLSPVDRSGRSLVYQSVFYPNANDLPEAEVLWLRPGQNMRGVDLTLPLVETVEIQGAVDSVKGPLANVDIRVGPTGNIGLETVELSAAVATTDERGHFVVLGVPPGLHTLLAEYRSVKVKGPTIVNTPYGLGESGSITVAPVTDQTPLLIASTPLSVGTANIVNCNLTLFRAPSLRGTLRFEGGSEQPDSKILLARSAIVRATDESLAVRVSIDPSGEFYFPSLMPRAYFLSIENTPGWSIRSIEVGGRPVDDNQIDLSYGSIETVEMYMTNDAASIQGVVVRKDGRIEPNATVLLFPATALSQKANAWVQDGWSLHASDTGQFAVGSLKPGDYYLAAVADAWFDLDWREKDILQILARQATRIRLGERQVGRVTLTGQQVTP